MRRSVVLVLDPIKDLIADINGQPFADPAAEAELAIRSQ